MSRYNRQLVIVNTETKEVVSLRKEVATNSAARITKGMYQTLTDGKHVAYYAHVPTKLRVPAFIKGRYYVKPAGWTLKA
jgi:hypothetical protein